MSEQDVCTCGHTRAMHVHLVSTKARDDIKYLRCINSECECAEFTDSGAKVKKERMKMFGRPP